MSTIPANQLVDVNPSVVGAGGNALDVIGLVLTQNVRVPIGAVNSFPSAQAVADFFGSGTDEANIAATYFAGFDGSSAKPASILFAQYPGSAVQAYVLGGDISGLTLAQLQAFNATLNVTIDSVLKTASINLSAVTSFSNAAAFIGASLAIHGTQAAAVTGAISATTLTVSAVGSGTIAVGDPVTGTGVTAGTYITALGTGTGGTGTYNVSASQTVGSEALTIWNPGVTYDSVSGGFKIVSGTTGATSTITYGSGAMGTDLLLTLATGATISQGAAAAVPATFMDGVVAVTTDWATFMTSFDPDNSGNTVKQAFAAWNTLQNDRYAYVVWDTDVLAESAPPQATTLGYVLANNDNSGAVIIWAPDQATGIELAAFACGAAASVDFEEVNGRVDFAYKSQSGISGSVTDGTKAVNLGGNPQGSGRGNGYNFYGAYGAANQSFIWFQRGFVTGDFLWMDSYVNQIAMNNSFQLALLTLLQNARSIPYTATGRGLIEAALADPIQQYLAFGAFAPGSISTAQKAEVNADAGADIADSLQTQGYYLQVVDADAATRAARGSPTCKFFYLDRGSVQAITLSSIAVQ